MKPFADFLLVYPSVAVVFFAVLALAGRWLTMKGNRERVEWLLVASTLAIPMEMVAQAAATALSALRPLKYDLYVYRLDAALGEPSFVLGRWAARWPVFHGLVSVSYGLLPVAMLVALGAYLYGAGKAETWVLVKTFLLNLFCALPVYLCFPVCGPEFSFSDFPTSPGEIAPHPILLSAAPNGVPSVHFSTALLVAWFLWRWRWGRMVGIMFCVLTGLATMGSGQHFAFDLVCAVPYAALMVWLGRKR